MRKPNDANPGRRMVVRRLSISVFELRPPSRKTTPKSSRQKEKRLTRSSVRRQQLERRRRWRVVVVVDASAGVVKEDGGWFISGCRPSVGSLAIVGTLRRKSPRFVASTSNGLCGCTPSVFKLQGASARLGGALTTSAQYDGRPKSHRRAASHSDSPTLHCCRRASLSSQHGQCTRSARY